MDRITSSVNLFIPEKASPKIISPILIYLRGVIGTV